MLDNPQQIDLKDAQEMLDLAQQQRDVLEAVAPNVNPAATDELKKANSVSSEVSRKAAKVIIVLAEPTPVATDTPTAGVDLDAGRNHANTSRYGNA